MAYFQLMGSFPPGYFISAITFLESTFNTCASSGMFSVNWAVNKKNNFLCNKIYSFSKGNSFQVYCNIFNNIGCRSHGFKKKIFNKVFSPLQVYWRFMLPWQPHFLSDNLKNLMLLQLSLIMRYMRFYQLAY